MLGNGTELYGQGRVISEFVHEELGYLFRDSPNQRCWLAKPSLRVRVA